MSKRMVVSDDGKFKVEVEPASGSLQFEMKPGDHPHVLCVEGNPIAVFSNRVGALTFARSMENLRVVAVLHDAAGDFLRSIQSAPVTATPEVRKAHADQMMKAAHALIAAIGESDKALKDQYAISSEGDILGGSRH